MASKRKIGREMEDSTNGRTDSTHSREHVRSKRKLRVPQDTSTNLKWIGFILVLSLAILGLIYYYNYYQPSPKTSTPKQRTSQGTVNSTSKVPSKKPPKTEKSEGKTKSPKPDSSPKKSKQGEKSTSDKKPQKPPATKKPQTETKSKKSESKKPPQSQSGTNSRGPDLELSPEEVAAIFNPDGRALHYPIKPSDADRPYMLDLLNGDKFLVNGEYSKALETFNGVLKRLGQSPRALLGKAMALENIAEKRKNSKVLDNAIEFYRKVGVESFLAPEEIKEYALIRLVGCTQKSGKHEIAIDALERLFEIDPKNDGYALQLGLAYTKSNRLLEAKEQFLNITAQWPNNTFAIANLGYLYYVEKDYSSAVPLLLLGLENEHIKMNHMFYEYAGEALSKLDRKDEAHALYTKAVNLKIFPSLWQRSVINEAGLRAQPWWNIEDTGVESEIRKLEKEVDMIRSELFSVLDEEVGFLNSSNQEKSVWMLYSNGERDSYNCHMTPKSCDLIAEFVSAAKCRRGETRILSLPTSLHIPSHVGPTNTRLRALLPLKLSSGSLRVRVAQETKELQEQKVVVIDDSFEQEVWYKGNKRGLLLIVEFWHPDLSETKRTTLSSL